MKIPIKKFTDDLSKSWRERFKLLKVHHEEETKYLIEQIKLLEDKLKNGSL